jgi:hypothetical protein
MVVIQPDGYRELGGGNLPFWFNGEHSLGGLAGGALGHYLYPT